MGLRVQGNGMALETGVLSDWYEGNEGLDEISISGWRKDGVGEVVGWGQLGEGGSFPSSGTLPFYRRGNRS